MYHIDKSVKSHQENGSNRSLQLAALAELLKDDEIELICQQLGHKWRNRIFTPAVTVRSMVHRALNPVMRLVGTINGKGTAIPDRPHRRAYFATEPLFTKSFALSKIRASDRY